MAKDFSTMKAEVGKFVTDTSTNFSALISTWLNEKYVDVSRRHKWSALIDFSHTVTLVVGQTNYTLPTDFDVEIYCADITCGYEIPRMDEANWFAERGSAYSGGSISSGEPERYVILREQDDLFIDPPPSVTHTLAFPYRKSVTALSGDTDTVVIKDIETALIYGAIAEALAYKRQYAKADYYFQKYEEEVAKRIGQERSQINQMHQRIPANAGTPYPKRLLGEVPYA